MKRPLVVEAAASLAERAPQTPAPLPVLRPDPLYHVVILALSSGILVLAIVLSVRNQTQVVVPVINQPLPELCLMRRFSTIGCPGCGMTRCFISLARGDVASAWSYNPAGLLLFAMVVFQIPFRLVQLARIHRGQPELGSPMLVQLVLGTLAAALIGQWALKLAGAAF